MKGNITKKVLEELKHVTVDTNYRIGMRVVKTAVAVFICIAIAWLIGSDNIVQISAVSAIMTLRATREDTIHHGVFRVLGTGIGGIIGLLTVIIGLFLPYYSDGLFVLVIPLMLVLNLYICNLLKMHDSCTISCVITIIVASHIYLDAPVAYTLIFTLMRLRDTLIGAVVATVIDLVPSYFSKRKKA